MLSATNIVRPAWAGPVVSGRFRAVRVVSGRLGAPGSCGPGRGAGVYSARFLPFSARRILAAQEVGAGGLSKAWNARPTAIVCGRRAPAGVVYAVGEDGRVISCGLVRPVGEVARKQAAYERVSVATAPSKEGLPDGLAEDGRRPAAWLARAVDAGPPCLEGAIGPAVASGPALASGYADPAVGVGVSAGPSPSAVRAARAVDPCPLPVHSGWAWARERGPFWARARE